MNKGLFSTIKTPHAPKAVASYSQGVVRRIGDQYEVITSGQIAFDPQSGKLEEGGIIPQSQRVLQNIAAILEAGGAHPGDVFKTDVVITESTDFVEFNKVYGDWEWIAGQKVLPTRFTSVGGLLIPGARVEVRCHATYPISRANNLTSK